MRKLKKVTNFSNLSWFSITDKKITQQIKLSTFVIFQDKGSILKQKQWEENFDKQQKIQEEYERKKEEKLKLIELEQRRLREEDYQNLNDEISSQLKELDIKTTTKN